MRAAHLALFVSSLPALARAAYIFPRQPFQFDLSTSYLPNLLSEVTSDCQGLCTTYISSVQSCVSSQGSSDQATALQCACKKDELTQLGLCASCTSQDPLGLAGPQLPIQNYNGFVGQCVSLGYASLSQELPVPSGTTTSSSTGSTRTAARSTTRSSTSTSRALATSTSSIVSSITSSSSSFAQETSAPASSPSESVTSSTSQAAAAMTTTTAASSSSSDPGAQYKLGNPTSAPGVYRSAAHSTLRDASLASRTGLGIVISLVVMYASLSLL